jgi:DNA-binding response OmpR family regulator
MRTKSILLVNVDLKTAQLDIAELEGTEVALHVSETFEEGFRKVLRSPFDMLIADARIDSNAAFELCRMARATTPSVKLGLIVGDPDIIPNDFAVDVLIVRCSIGVKALEKRVANTDI